MKYGSIKFTIFHNFFNVKQYVKIIPENKSVLLYTNKFLLIYFSTWIYLLLIDIPLNIVGIVPPKIGSRLHFPAVHVGIS